MKILMLTSYVTINTRPEFTRNKTGFGYMVYDIAKSVGAVENVDVLCTDTRGDGFEMEGVHYLDRSFRLFLKNIFNCVPFWIVLRIWARYHASWGALIRLMYYWIMSGYLVAILRNNNYDILHIHQNVFDTELWIAACKKTNQRFVITLHGLNSFSDTVKLELGGKQYERDMLQRVCNGEFPITVISTGMKRLIEQTFGNNGMDSISIVCNAFSFADGSKEVRIIRKDYSLPQDSKVILYVGNVCLRKNQKQIVYAFDKLDFSLSQNVYVLFLGENLEADYNLEETINNSPNKNHFIICGGIDKEFISNYYEQGDYVALLSLSEGFGLCLIEGLHFGLPCITFTDVDAYPDIYDPAVMIGVDGHSDDAVTDGLRRLLTAQWDKKAIKDYSKKFECETMASNYISVYKKILIK